MSEASPTFRQATLWDTEPATSSPELVGGGSLSGSPAGPTTGPCGPDLARVSRSARRASGKGKRTTGTSGRTSSASSTLAALRSSLASKSSAARSLGERMALSLMESMPPGSMEYVLTWKAHRTPSKRLIYRLRASGRRTSDSACSGWPTPDTGSVGGRVSKDPAAKVRPNGTKKQFNLTDAAMLAGWPTATVRDTRGLGSPARTERLKASGHMPSILCEAAQLAGWPTPAANEFEPTDVGRMLERREEIKDQGINGNGFGLTLGMAAHLAGWATPQANDSEKRGVPADRENCSQTCLPVQSQLAGWATPGANDNKATSGGRGREKNPSLRCQAEDSVSGTPSTSSPAGTARRGVLNPALSRWLLAYPKMWDRCSPYWQSWVTIQKLLAKLSERPDEIGSFGSGDMETQSSRS